MGNEGNPELLKKLANRIKELRAKKGLTQEEVFNDSGIHVARLETGKRDFSVSTLEKLCTYFDVSFVEFFKGIKD
jgi:transcriptional regulator with XRE-family HTH domain